MSNAIDNNAVDDKALDEYLSGGSEYSRRYRAVEFDGVPADLDRLVLTEASASAGKLTPISRKRTRPLGFWMRVSAPVALAASVVLVVSVVIRSGMQTPTLDSQIALESDAPAASPRIERLERADVTASDTANETSSETTREEAPRTYAAQAKPLPAAPPAESPAPRPQSAEAPSLDRVVVNAPAVRAVAEDAALPVEVTASENLAAADSAAQKQAAASESRTRQEQSGQARDLEEIIVTGHLRRAPTQPPAGPRGTIRPASGPSAAEIAQQEREADPESWLRHIRELRATGKRREADREWREFVEAYPNYEVDAADSARPK